MFEMAQGCFTNNWRGGYVQVIVKDAEIVGDNDMDWMIVYEFGSLDGDVKRWRCV